MNYSALIKKLDIATSELRIVETGTRQRYTEIFHIMSDVLELQRGILRVIKRHKL